MSLALSFRPVHCLQFQQSAAVDCYLCSMVQVQSSFKGKVNFVALNIDNSKWTGEVAQYRVRGVPHFAFLDKHGKQQAAV